MALATGELTARPARRIALDRWPTRLLIGAAGLNVTVLLVQLHGFIHSLYRNADWAAPEVLAALSANAGPGRVVNLGDHPFYEAWWLETATRGLPGHWQIWEGMPFVIAFFGIALMAWAAWRALGAFAALVTTTVMLALGDAMRQILFSSDTHGYVIAHGALLAAAIVFLAERARRGELSWTLLAALGAPLIALSAVGASDQIFEFVFLPSFALAGCVTWWRHPGPAQRRIAVFCLVVCGASILGAELLDAFMRSQHVIAAYFPITFVAPTSIFASLQNTITSVAILGGGAFFAAPVAGTALLVFAIGALVLLGFALVLRFVWRYASSLHTRGSTASPARDTYIAFWSLALVLSLAVYMLTNVAAIEDTERYLPGLYAGVAALLPLLAARGRVQHAAVAIATALFATLVATDHLLEGTSSGTNTISPRTAYQIMHFVKAEGADHGYAAYQTAFVATWETRTGLKVYPLSICNTNWCVPSVTLINNWYRANNGIRTFLIGDPVAGPTAAFGKALSTATFGPYTVYVYDHDVAANLG